MKTNTINATIITPANAIAAIATGIVVVASSVVSSRLGWRSYVHGECVTVSGLKRPIQDRMDCCHDLASLLLRLDPAMPSCQTPDQMRQRLFA